MIDDDRLLALLRHERKASIGFDEDDELAAQRNRAHEYMAGVMKDVPSLKNRSAAVSTDVADGVRTVMPDLMEIFTGGDDVATFTPMGAEDEEAARQETDVVNHVVFQRNDGFGLIYTLCNDALVSKVGVTKTIWEPDETEDVAYSGQTEAQLMMLAQEGELAEVTADDGGQGLYSCTVRTVVREGQVRIIPVPPEDFTVGRDTRLFGGGLEKATYCAMRTRPRAQELIGDGYDRALVDALKDAEAFTERDAARDTVNEGDDDQDGVGDLRHVEVVEHFLRVDADGSGKPQLWRCITGNDEGVLLKREKVDRNPFSAACPFPVTHRFYGHSLADLLLEVQRIKTALTRMMLDSGYFALNQRVEIDMGKAGDYGVADFMQNEPGVPVRVEQGGAITPISSGAPNFPILQALEHVSTMAEQRTGVVRNAQGLNPDTLHDTARGQQALMGAAQKRVRMIARILAETGIKDLFLGVHHLLRKHGSRSMTLRLRGKWVDVDPSTWGSRADMTIEIGLGSGGKEQEQAVMQALMEVQERIIQAQGGPQGPLVTLPNVFAAAKRMAEVGGIKAPETYFTDPTTAPPQPQQQPAPDPQMAKVQGQLQLQAQKQQGDLQVAGQRMQLDAQMKREEIAARTQADMAKAQAEVTLKERQMILEAQMAAARPTVPQAAPVRFGGVTG